jgi:hypothetical protein
MNRGDGSIYFKLSIPENRTVPFSPWMSPLSRSPRAPLYRSRHCWGTSRMRYGVFVLGQEGCAIRLFSLSWSNQSKLKDKDLVQIHVAPPFVES